MCETLVMADPKGHLTDERDRRAVLFSSAPGWWGTD